MTNITAAENTNKLGSIAITVNKLTIGVTVKKWSSVFLFLRIWLVLSNIFQAIFLEFKHLIKKNGNIIKKRRLCL
ncbi:MAG: hypothetical protein L6U99_07535 [Clostridium sp.]|nr:MAG: hypothetical protein L6U99_07535 [Clostridium sp.]